MVINTAILIIIILTMESLCIILGFICIWNWYIEPYFTRKFNNLGFNQENLEGINISTPERSFPEINQLILQRIADVLRNNTSVSGATIQTDQEPQVLELPSMRQT